jgi:CHAT domain-containing protein
MLILLKKNTWNNRYTILIPCIAFIYLFTAGSEISVINNSEKSNIAWYYSRYLEANKLFEEGKYLDAVDNYKQLFIYNKHIRNWGQQVSTLIDIVNCYRNSLQYKIAEKYLQKADSIAKTHFTQGHLIFSDLLSAQSGLAYVQGEYPKSIQLAISSIRIRKSKSTYSDSLLIYPYIFLGLSHAALGKNDEAIKNYSTAIYCSLSCKNHNSVELMSCWNNMGQIYWDQGIYDEAMNCYQNALNMNLVINNNSTVTANNFSSIALLYSQIGQYEYAFKYLFLAENILLKKSDGSKSALGMVRINKAFIYLKTHDYKRVLSECIKAKDDFQADTINNKTYLSYLYYYMGSGYSGLNKSTEAINCYSKCINIKQQLKQSYDANSFLLLAKAYEKMNQIEKSDSTYNIIINYLEKNYESQNPILANILINYGTFCLDNDKLNIALLSYNKALKICLNKYGFYNLITTTVYNDLGELLLKQDKYDEALQNFQLALSSQIKNINSSDFYANPSLKNITADIHLLSTLKGKGCALYKKYISDSSNTNLLLASLKSYILAVTAIDKLKILYSNSESSAALMENEKETFDDAIKVASQLYFLSDSVKYFNLAFSFAEKRKSSTLLATIRDNDAFVAGKVPLAFQKIEKDLQLQINQYKQLLYEENKSEEVDNKKTAYSNARILELSSYNDYLIQYLERSYPEYYNLKYNTSVINTDTVASKLSPNEIFIEYAMTSDKLISFIITGKTRKIVSISADTILTNSISDYLHYSNNPDAKESESCNLFISSSTKLYNLLLKPLNIDITDKKLIIIPDEQLYNIPFESLLYTDVSGKVSGFRNLPYLINKAAISYAASATLLYNNESDNTEVNNRLLAFAPSYVSNSDISSNNDETTRSSIKSLKPLKWSIDEVKTINSIFDGNVYTGMNATLKNFRQNSSSFGILHLAMHTIIDDLNPMYSKLVFNRGLDDNGLLTTSEIYGMQINSQLSVLSACNTGTGKLVKGEGMLCLARGFMYAGCSSLVMTLWEINDKSGSELMKSFYSYLSKGKPKDEALRFAKLDYINKSGDKKSNPYYWAGYINFGNHKPLLLKKNIVVTKPVYIEWASLTSVFLLLFFILKKHLLKKETMLN